MNISFYILGAWFIYHSIEHFLHRFSHNSKSGYIYKIHKNLMYAVYVYGLYGSGYRQTYHYQRVVL